MRAPARCAIAYPSPVATVGLVVCLNTCPSPPVAITTASPYTSAARPSMETRTPMQRPLTMMRSSTRAVSSTCTFGDDCTRSISVRDTSAPVWSPCACTMRRRECAASLPSLKSPRALRSKRAPASTSSRTRSGPSFTSTSTAFTSQSAAPAASVSRRCSSGLSPAPSAAAMPPCAHIVLESRSVRFVISSTGPCAAHRHAVKSPATPLPMTMMRV